MTFAVWSLSTHPNFDKIAGQEHTLRKYIYVFLERNWRVTKHLSQQGTLKTKNIYNKTFKKVLYPIHYGYKDTGVSLEEANSPEL